MPRMVNGIKVIDRAVQNGNDYYAPLNHKSYYPNVSDKQCEMDGKIDVLHCGKCNAPKETCNYWYDGRGWVLQRCACKCHGSYVRQNDIDMERREVFGGARELINARINNDDHQDKEASRLVNGYINVFYRVLANGKGLNFFGKPGTGKTWFSACIVNSAINQHKRCKFSTAYELINAYLESKSKNDFLERLKGYDIVVIDDLGIENVERRSEAIFDIVNTLYNNGRSVITTTNLSVEDVVTDRVFSRLGQRNTPIVLVGEDRRKNDRQTN